jgi:hypothetical protein
LGEQLLQNDLLVIEGLDFGAVLVHLGLEERVDLLALLVEVSLKLYEI